MIESNCSFDFKPRPPDTTLSAVARSGRSLLVKFSEIQVVGQGALGSMPSSIGVDADPKGAAAKAVPRIVITLIESEDWTVRIALPA